MPAWEEAPIVDEAPAWESAPIVEAEPEGWSGRNYLRAGEGLVRGAVKGALNTVIGLGDLTNMAGAALGLNERDAEAFEWARGEVAPSNKAERAVMGAEQAAEFALLPGLAKVKGAMRVLQAGKTGLASAGLAKAQGATDASAAVTGALGAVPVAEGVIALGKWAGSKAAPLVRAAIKPTVASLQKIAGASREGLNAKAEQLVRFILENRVVSADKARAIFQEAEHELQRVLSVKNAPTDEPVRALRYLTALERSAAKQRLPAKDVDMIRDAAAELLEGSLGIERMGLRMDKVPGKIGFRGEPPKTVISNEPYREFRTSTPADEALEAARSSSRWQTRKQWGEQKGTDKEIRKAVERASRDAVKAAVPEAKALLKRESMAIQAEKALDRSEQRAANRDAVSLPAHVVAAGEIASGRLPVLAFAANWLRNNQLKAGIYADRLAKAIEQGNAPQVAFLLHNLGVGVSPQLMRASGS